MSKKIVVSGVGCTLVDRLFSNISFDADNLTPFLSRQSGDGGLTPGHLVFKEEFEKFAEIDFHKALKQITLNKDHDKINIGGPAIVPMIHAAQMAENDDCEYNIYAARGDDENGKIIMSLLKGVPVSLKNFMVAGNETPSTIVLSDPDYDQGHGERIFINSIGSAWEYTPDQLNDEFFFSDVVIFGGTGLMPLIHDNLTELLKRAKSKGCITIVNTVYDFRNEKANPHVKWPLGESDDSYQNIDLLMMDKEEALRLSGKKDMDLAMRFFRENGTGAVIVTSGTNNVRIFSDGSLFEILGESEMPISNAIYVELKKGHSGDTTGCGDNFVGGVIASIVSQIQSGIQTLSLKEACIWGIISGGTSCFYIGGMYEEKRSGEKRKMVEPYYEEYKKQIKIKK